MLNQSAVHPKVQPQHRFSQQLMRLAASSIRIVKPEFCFKSYVQTPLHRQVELYPFDFENFPVEAISKAMLRSIDILKRDVVGASILAAQVIAVFLPAKVFRQLSALHELDNYQTLLSARVPGFQVRLQQSPNLTDDRLQLRFGQSVSIISADHRLLKCGHRTVTAALTDQPFYLDHLLLNEICITVTKDTVAELHGHGPYQLLGLESTPISINQHGNIVMLTTSNSKTELQIIPVAAAIKTSAQPNQVSFVGVSNVWQETEDDEIGTYRGVAMTDDDEIGTYHAPEDDDDEIGTYRGPDKAQQAITIDTLTSFRLRLAGLVAKGPYVQQLGFAVQPAGVREKATAELQAVGITEVFQLSDGGVVGNSGDVSLSRNALLADKGKFFAMFEAFGLIDLMAVNLLADQHLRLQASATPGRWQVQLASDALWVYALNPAGDFIRLQNESEIDVFIGMQLVVGAMMFEVVV
jgi:hypothetical protein